MVRDRVIGVILIVTSMSAMVFFTWGLFLADSWLSVLLVRLMVMIIVVGVFSIVAWLGYMLAKLPSYCSVREMEKEIVEELRKIEETVRENSCK